ncbi:MAG: hypothetical protein HQ502_11090 [Alphaproteobacteria bacterium]|nr:hypothetical protein [Alphaproteobacteria bacterium]
MARAGWTLRGRILVEHLFQELTNTYGAISPMAGIKVRVQARERVARVWGSWKAWDDVIINEDDEGAFQVSKIKSHHNRRFRVQVQFKSADLVIFGANRTLLRQVSRALRMRALRSLGAELILDQLLQHFTRIPYEADWHTVHVDRTGSGRSPGVIDLGDLTFAVNAPNDLGDRIAHRQAELWFLYSRVIDLFESLGQDYQFKKKIAVKYPHNNPLLGDRIEASYANPENHVVYIVENSVWDDYARIDYVLHEIMHIWAYQHSRREKGIAWQLIIHGDTHGLQNRTWVAFHEGFAEWGYHQIYRRLFGQNPTIGAAGTTDIEPFPFKRSYLSSNYSLTSLEQVDRHEWGWVSILNLLTTPDLVNYTFNGNGKYIARTRARPARAMICDDPVLAFTDVLRLFLTDRQSGAARQLGRSEMNLSGILSRAVAVVPQFDRTAQTAVLSLLDPAETTMPRNLLCRPRR